MSTSLDRPTVETYEVERLVNLAWRGQLRVPEVSWTFQWRRGDVIRLFESIARGYPLGTLLLAARGAPAQRLTLGALSIDAPSMADALLVLDGQHRITSLANALHQDGSRNPRFALAYDLFDERFVPRPGSEEAHIVPLPILFDLSRLLRWFATYPEAADFQDRAYRLTTVLRQHPVAAYLLRREDDEALREISTWMNTSGRQPNPAEILAPSPAGDESGRVFTLPPDTIAARVNARTSFGRIDDDTMRLALRARPAVADLSKKGEGTGSPQDEEALLRAIEFLRHEAGVPHLALLPHRYLLVILTCVFGNFSELDPANRRLLRRWFWRTALLSPKIFHDDAKAAIHQLYRQVRPDDLTGSVRGLLDAVGQRNPPLPDPHGFDVNEAATKILLCSWWALEPRDPTTGVPFDAAQLADALTDQDTATAAVHYVFPHRTVPTEWHQYAANRLLVPTMEHQTGLTAGEALLHLPVSAGDADDWGKTLRSHLVTPRAAELLRADQVIPFLQERHEAIVAHLETFLARMCEWDFEDAPPIDDLLVEDFEGGDDAH